jgi:hypothetical protein
MKFVGRPRNCVAVGNRHHGIGSLMLFVLTNCTVMKKPIVNPSIAALLLVLGGCTTYDRADGMPPLRISTGTPERIVLRTDGAPGQNFSAILTVDGSRKGISAVTPAEFSLDCVVLVNEVTQMDRDASFSFIIERSDGTSRYHTPPVGNFSRFRYHSQILEIVARERDEFGGKRLEPTAAIRFGFNSCTPL